MCIILQLVKVLLILLQTTGKYPATFSASELRMIFCNMLQHFLAISNFRPNVVKLFHVFYIGSVIRFYMKMPFSPGRSNSVNSTASQNVHGL